MKAWLAESQRGKHKVTVGKKTLGYGKDDAVELTDNQLEQAKAALEGTGVVVQTDQSSSSSGSKEGDSAS